MTLRRCGRVQLAALAVAACAAGPAAATSCAVVAGSMLFGTYDTVASAATDTTGIVTVTCTPGLGDPLTTPYTLAVAGTGTGGDTVRSLASGAYRLHYQVYRDAGRSVVWGNSSGSGVAASVTSAATLTPGVQVHTAYARMPARQVVPPGVYLGSLMVTIEY